MTLALRERHSVSRWLRALAVILPLVVLLVTAQELVRTRRGSIEAVEMQMSRLDMVFAEQTGRAMETLDQILLSTADTVELLQESNVQNLMRLDEVMRRRIAGVRQIAGLAVTDADGHIIASTYPTIPDSVRSVLDSMLADASRRTEQMWISKPFRDGGGAWIALMTRPIRTLQGERRGLAVGFISLKYFEDFYEAVQLSENGAIVLHLRDGTVLARFPHTDSVIGTSFAELPPFRDILSKAPAGTVEMVSPVDGSVRVLAIRALRLFPLAVNVSVGRREVLQAWQSQAIVIGASALAVSFLIAGLLLLLAGRSHEREGMVLALAQANEAAVAASRQLTEEMAERERAEDALRKAQRIEAIGQLTGGVAHDFNNLLTVVLTNIEMLETSGHCQNEALVMLRNARAAAERGATVTGQLLAFSRQQPLRPTPLDLHGVLNGLSGLLHSALGETISLVLELEATWPAMADASQIELVMLNLALNARDAMPGGGLFVVRTQDVRRSTPDLPEQPPAGDYVQILVRDTGIGMTEEVRRRAFDPFFTTKGPGAGSGLGLSQVYGVARQSGGVAELESTPGEGTTISILLPRAYETVSFAPADAGPRPLSRAHVATILVVDDDFAVRDATVSILQRLGYAVLQAEGGQQALDVLQGHREVGLVVSDIVMPGMNGLDLARSARLLRPDLPFVFISGFSDPATVTGEGVPRRLVRKPFRSADLVGQIEAALSERDVRVS